MGQNNQKDQKGPKMTAAVMLVQNNQNNQKIWSLHISHTILKVRFFWDTPYIFHFDKVPLSAFVFLNLLLKYISSEIFRHTGLFKN